MLVFSPLFSFSLVILHVDAFSASPTSSSSAIISLHESLFSKVDSQLNLKLTGNNPEFNEWSLDGSTGTAEWWDESSGSKLTGVSKNTAKNDENVLCTLNLWVGPAYNVPHLLLSFGSDEDSIYIRSDYVNRGPTPIGSDDRVLDKFYNSNVQEWYNSIMNADGVTSLKPLNFGSRLLHTSPVAIAATGLDIDLLTTSCNTCIDNWLYWVANEEQNNPRTRGAFNARDDKLRSFAYSAAKSELAAFTTDIGLAAGWTGPISEAYVGGGS